MTRFAIAAILAATLCPVASAQPDPVTISPPVAVVPLAPTPLFGLPPAPNVFVRPGTPPGPAIPFYKSGGVAVGVYGYYPFDTGEWLLGGTEGQTRQSGSFTMVYPDLPAPGPRHPFLHKHGLYRR